MSEVRQAPKVTLFDGQTAAFIDQAGSVPVTDLQDPVLDVVVKGTPLSSLTYGQAVTIIPRMSADGTRVILDMRPASQGVIATPAATFTIGGVPIEIFMPIVAPSVDKVAVSVPDGGTLLIGGIKNVSDHGMSGVPLLNKIPYINRLFKNVSIARESESLMMMVTPRIIIQEEEEE